MLCFVIDLLYTIKRKHNIRSKTINWSGLSGWLDFEQLAVCGKHIIIVPAGGPTWKGHRAMDKIYAGDWQWNFKCFA